MKLLKYILLSVFILSTLISKAQTIYVDAANNTGIEDGTEQHPFNTIKEGINTATPGNRVMISQGTYYPDDSWSGNDQTLLLKAGVGLIGESHENTLIDGIVVDQEFSNLSISLENLSFDEFHFARGTIAGPFDEQNVIRNCATQLINLPFGAGIPVNDTTWGPNYGFLIEDNDLGTDGSIDFNQGPGVSQMIVLNNTCGYIDLMCGSGYTFLVDNNDVQYGILDKSGANHTSISNNRIYDGAIIDKSGGIQIGIEDEVIENNIITCNENSPVFIDEDYKGGIIARSKSVTIRNNTITCTGHVSGIRSSTGSPLHIIDNTITLDEVQVPNPDPVEGTIGIFNISGWGYVTGNNIYGGQNGYYSKAGTALFADNEIQKAFTGFYSKGAEEVRHNTIKDCNGDGMILAGLRGPVFDNVIKDNAGAGIHVIRVPIDLGGGADTCPGNNVIMGNGNYDLYIETQNAQYPTLYARYNVWDHTSPADINFYDIRDGSDSTGLVSVDFTPWGYLGVEEQGSGETWRHGGMGAGKQECVEVFPNPVKGSSVTIRSDKEISEVKIFSIVGQEVINTTFRGEREITLDVSSLKNGIYCFKAILQNRTSNLIRVAINR